jgi:hypothetical protein
VNNEKNEKNEKNETKKSCCLIHRFLFLITFSLFSFSQVGAAAASSRATQTFVAKMAGLRSKFVSISRVGWYLLEALNEAHTSVVGIKNAPGTTTLLGSVLVQAMIPQEDVSKLHSNNNNAQAISPRASVNLISFLDAPPKSTHDLKWVLVSVSIGDCKSFLLRNGVATEISPAQRSSLNVRDPGGRIGVTNESNPSECYPEVGNMMLNYVSVEPNDVLLYCSDGVHDNLNPTMLGVSPGEISADHTGKAWSELHVDDGNSLISKWRLEKLSQLSKPHLADLPTLASTIISYCEKTTERSRQAMERNDKDVPKDAGKMDHVSVLLFRVPPLPSGDLK